MILNEDQKKLIKQGLMHIWHASNSKGQILTPAEQKEVQALLVQVTDPKTVVLIEVDNGDHLIDIRLEPNGQLAWIIQHSLHCRPDLFDCPFNNEMHFHGENGTLPKPGRYVGILDLLLGSITLREAADGQPTSVDDVRAAMRE